MNRLMLLFLVVLLVIAVMVPTVYFLNQAETGSASDEFFFGVTFGGNSISQAKLLIDKIKKYSNLFIVNSWEICGAANETILNEVCEYAVNAGLNVMVYFNFVYYNYTEDIGNIYNASSWDLHGVSPWHIEWLNNAMAKWGSKFLGAYLYDEPGGKQIDLGYWNGELMTGEPPAMFVNVTTYSQAATNYTLSLLQSGSMQHITNSSIPNVVNSRVRVFTSDYALYWFDYLGGYDAVFAQLGGTGGINRKIQQIALCRGSATAQNSQWGTIIIWTYNNPPYMEDADELLQDMMMSYQAGANYLIIFNYPYNSTSKSYGILSQNHFNVMELFWSQIHDLPRGTPSHNSERVAFVLPKDYGWGMRRPDDSIWGLFPADKMSLQIWNNMNKLTEEYGVKLDIIYDDPQFNIASTYGEVYYWNSTIT